MVDIVATRGRRRMSAIEWVATAGVLLVLAAVLPLALAGERFAQVAKARAWTVQGPACPTVTGETARALAHKVAHVIDYDGVLFGRGYGYVSCILIADQGGRGLNRLPVCQFNSPTVLQVTTATGTTYYSTWIRPATVTVEHGRPHCVIGQSIGP